jgi:hypothetical protein
MPGGEQLIHVAKSEKDVYVFVRLSAAPAKTPTDDNIHTPVARLGVALGVARRIRVVCGSLLGRRPSFVGVVLLSILRVAGDTGSGAKND